MNPQLSFGYNGSKFSIVNEDSFAFISANSVCVWNTATNKKEYINSKKNGYTCCAANYMKGFIAAAEYGLDPDIHIYKYPGNQLVAKIPAETKIRCMDLEFSRDCTRLLMIGDKPDYKISIYNLENQKFLTLDEKLIDKKYLTCGFNPSDPNQFFVSSPENLVFYNIVTNSYREIHEDGEGGIDKCERVNHIIYKPPTPDTIYKDIVWDPYSKLYIATDQKTLHQVDFNTGEEKMKITLEDIPRCLILTQKHLIVGLENSKLIWYSALPPEETPHNSNLLLKEKLIQLTSEIDKNYLFENGGIKYMKYTKNFKRIIFGCDDGFLSLLPLEAEIYNYEDEEDEDEGSVKEIKIVNTQLIELGKFHTGAITGIKELGETTQIVTVGEDNLLCIWEATSGSCLFREKLSCKLTTLEASEDGSKIFIGSDGGVVRIYDISNRCLPRLVKMHKLFHTPVTRICISFDQRIVAVSSKDSKEV